MQIEISEAVARAAAAQIRLSLAVTPMSEQSRKALSTLLQALDAAEQGRFRRTLKEAV